jgi:hypothetical protein
MWRWSSPPAILPPLVLITKEVPVCLAPDVTRKHFPRRTTRLAPSGTVGSANFAECREGIIANVRFAFSCAAAPKCNYVQSNALTQIIMESQMSKLPPVPPANRSPKGPGIDPNVEIADTKPDERVRNLAEQGRQGNIKQNTTNQGYQQDR